MDDDLMGSAFWMFHLVRNMVKVVITTSEWINACVDSVACIHHPTQNPQGIPVWMMFSFYFWTNPNHPLGPTWTLNPEPYTLEHADYSPNQYLGYSVEPNCLRQPFIPPEEREKQVYVMGKYLHYFYGPESTWTPDFYDEAAEANGISFVVGASQIQETNSDAESTLPKSIVNNGLLPPEIFSTMVAHSRMLIGVGSPYT